MLDDAIRNPAPVPAPREPEGPPRGSCGDGGARIIVVGRALEDGLCKLCREEAAALGAAVVPTPAATPAGQETCSGRDGTVPCGRKSRIRESMRNVR
ncbi:hypothetical protein BFF78_00085 [Streptomyces fodineus]|uniref:Uncharacterized protein n=1 Tax=Streptomyces fodineus TaxID=1904616 RepID=A0A1D7Y296_9ACTN|nr:hypothetical protein [Streptomyces fodineus]AOR29704.1 hypothetical protein BFF78_00085 [Streptomyces fodineus]